MFLGTSVVRAAESADIGVLINNAKDKYSVAKPDTLECPEPNDSDEIVVCARRQDETKFRVQSTAVADWKSEAARDDGLPRAPNVSALPPCDAINPCIGMGYAPPPIYIIDVTAFPEAPPGSDADRIARGLSPKN